MKGSKKLNILIIALILTAISSTFLYKSGSKVGTKQAAKAMLRTEYINIKKDNISLAKENSELEDQISAIDKERQKLIDTDSELKESTELIAEYKKKNEELQKELDTLNLPGDLNTKYESQIRQISNEVAGDKITYNDIILASGQDILPGRYRISGDGSFRIIKKATNSVIESQNVGLLESDSYTANIEDECTVIIDGTLDFTPVN